MSLITYLKSIQKVKRTPKAETHKNNFLDKITLWFDATPRDFEEQILPRRDKKTAEEDLEWLKQAKFYILLINI